MSLETSFITDDGSQEAQWHRDLQGFEQEAREALVASLTRPLTVDEVSAISWWAGLSAMPARVVPALPRDGSPPF